MHSYPWRTTSRMGFKSVPVLRRMWTLEFRNKYLRDRRIASIHNNLYRIANPTQ
jgi:hypothetical protein